jgi:predicted dienelactone hydrolase
VAKRGVAAVTVCSHEFVALGQAQARALGHANLPIAVIPHPFGSRTRDEVRQIAEQCADDIVRLLAEATPQPAKA